MGRRGTVAREGRVTMAKNQFLGPDARVQVPSPPLAHQLTSANHVALLLTTSHNSRMELTAPSPFMAAQRASVTVPGKFCSVRGMLQM